jgi:hypothetical protein
MITAEIPERMRTCEHRLSPAVHRVTLSNGERVDASRCLRCGLWLALTQPRGAE